MALHRLLTALLVGATLATPALAQGRDAPRGSRNPGDPRDVPVRADPPGSFDTIDQVGRRPNRNGRFEGRDAPPEDRFDDDIRDARDDEYGDDDRRGDRGRIDSREDPAGRYGQDDGYDRNDGYDRYDDDRGYARDGDRRQDGAGWDRDWRGDRRYDWQSYRRDNARAFRLPRYYGPQGIGRGTGNGFGTGYRRWTPGDRIQPAYYGRGYRIARPDLYRLPPARGSYRWVRYYDDVALVDIRSGLVADILYAFFL